MACASPRHGSSGYRGNRGLVCARGGRLRLGGRIDSIGHPQHQPESDGVLAAVNSQYVDGRIPACRHVGWRRFGHCDRDHAEDHRTRPKHDRTRHDNDRNVAHDDGGRNPNGDCHGAADDRDRNRDRRCAADHDTIGHHHAIDHHDNREFNRRCCCRGCRSKCSGSLRGRELGDEWVARLGVGADRCRGCCACDLGSGRTCPVETAASRSGNA